MNTRRFLLIGVALSVPLLMATAAASAQSSGESSSKLTTPPPNWEDQFGGWFGDSENQMPPGFPPYSTTNPFRTIEKVIAPLLQPWAAARKDATIFEIEEVGSFCRPTGLFLRHQNRGFQLLVPWTDHHGRHSTTRKPNTPDLFEPGPFEKSAPDFVGRFRCALGRRYARHRYDRL